MLSAGACCAGVRASLGALPMSRLALSSLASDADVSPAPSQRLSARENDGGSGNKAAKVHPSGALQTVSTACQRLLSMLEK